METGDDFDIDPDDASDLANDLFPLTTGISSANKESELALHNSMEQFLGARHTSLHLGISQSDKTSDSDKTSEQRMASSSKPMHYETTIMNREQSNIDGEALASLAPTSFDNTQSLTMTERQFMIHLVTSLAQSNREAVRELLRENHEAFRERQRENQKYLLELLEANRKASLEVLQEQRKIFVDAYATAVNHAGPKPQRSSITGSSGFQQRLSMSSSSSSSTSSSSSNNTSFVYEPPTIVPQRRIRKPRGSSLFMTEIDDIIVKSKKLAVRAILGQVSSAPIYLEDYRKDVLNQSNIAQYADIRNSNPNVSSTADMHGYGYVNLHLLLELSKISLNNGEYIRLISLADSMKINSVSVEQSNSANDYINTVEEYTEEIAKIIGFASNRIELADSDAEQFEHIFSPILSKFGLRITHEELISTAIEILESDLSFSVICADYGELILRTNGATNVTTVVPKSLVTALGLLRTARYDGLKVEKKRRIFEPMGKLMAAAKLRLDKDDYSLHSFLSANSLMMSTVTASRYPAPNSFNDKTPVLFGCEMTICDRFTKGYDKTCYSFWIDVASQIMENEKLHKLPFVLLVYRAVLMLIKDCKNVRKYYNDIIEPRNVMNNLGSISNTSVVNTINPCAYRCIDGCMLPIFSSGFLPDFSRHSSPTTLMLTMDLYKQFQSKMPAVLLPKLERDELGCYDIYNPLIDSDTIPIDVLKKSFTADDTMLHVYPWRFTDTIVSECLEMLRKPKTSRRSAVSIGITDPAYKTIKLSRIANIPCLLQISVAELFWIRLNASPTGAFCCLQQIKTGLELRYLELRSLHLNSSMDQIPGYASYATMLSKLDHMNAWYKYESLYDEPADSLTSDGKDDLIENDDDGKAEMSENDNSDADSNNSNNSSNDEESVSELSEDEDGDYVVSDNHSIRSQGVPSEDSIPSRKRKNTDLALRNAEKRPRSCRFF